MERLRPTVGWIIVAIQWLCVVVFAVFVYLGLEAGYNSAIPIIGTPTPAFLLFMRIAIGLSLIVGITATLITVVGGTSGQRETAILPGIFFAYVLFVISHEFF